MSTEREEKEESGERNALNLQSVLVELLLGYGELLAHVQSDVKPTNKEIYLWSEIHGRAEKLLLSETASASPGTAGERWEARCLRNASGDEYAILQTHDGEIRADGWEWAATAEDFHNASLERACLRVAEETQKVIQDLLEVTQPCNAQDPALLSHEECPANHPNCCGRCSAVHQARSALATLRKALEERGGQS